jgi:hypothetical protein
MKSFMLEPTIDLGSSIPTKAAPDMFENNTVPDQSTMTAASSMLSTRQRNKSSLSFSRDLSDVFMNFPVT